MQTNNTSACQCSGTFVIRICRNKHFVEFVFFHQAADLFGSSLQAGHVLSVTPDEVLPAQVDAQIRAPFSWARFGLRRRNSRLLLRCGSKWKMVISTSPWIYHNKIHCHLHARPVLAVERLVSFICGVQVSGSEVIPYEPQVLCKNHAAASLHGAQTSAYRQQCAPPHPSPIL